MKIDEGMVLKIVSAMSGIAFLLLMAMKYLGNGDISFAGIMICFVAMVSILSVINIRKKRGI